jgi:hypothetical protein
MGKVNRSEGSRYRYPFLASAKIVRNSEADPVEIRVDVNCLSRMGLGAFSSEPVDTGTGFLISLGFFGPEGKRMEDTLEGNVIWASPHEDRYYIGVEFDEEVNYDVQPRLYRHFHRSINDD